MTRGSLIVGSLCLFTSVAQAHISVDQGGTQKSRYTDTGLKGSPCGMAGGTRGTKISTYKPGATITVSIVETIPHPGYFRIAFDNDGDDGFLIPSGTDGAMGNCGGDPKCGPGKADYCNSPSVLLDNLDPHTAGAAPKHTWSVTLPNVECTNCTLQIIEVMNDLAPFHPAPYPADDIYYQCIDLVLSKTAPDVTPPATPIVNKGMVCAGAAPAGTGGMAAAGGTGGMAMTGAGGTGGVPAAMTGGAPAVVPPAGTGGGAAAGSVGVPPAGAGGMAVPVAGGAAVPPVTTPGSGSKADSGGCSAAGGSSPLGMVGMFGLALLALMRRRHTLRV